MGAYLRTLKAFQVEAKTTSEEVLDDGQKIQYAGVVNIVARFPDRLRAEVENDRYSRQFLYDGKNFTLWARRVNYYATIAAPKTIGLLADLLEDQYGIEVPLSDLFRWGAPGWKSPVISAALDVGPSQVSGTTCEQYAFRQEGLDWQVWIQRGDYPLPRKLVLTSLEDEARPQFTAVYTWNLAPSFNEAAFTFDPPIGAVRVVLAENAPAAGAGEIGGRHVKIHSDPIRRRPGVPALRIHRRRGLPRPRPYQRQSERQRQPECPCGPECQRPQGIRSPGR